MREHCDKVADDLQSGHSRVSTSQRVCQNKKNDGAWRDERMKIYMRVAGSRLIQEEDDKDA
jgi:hypothetical protein